MTRLKSIENVVLTVLYYQEKLLLLISIRVVSLDKTNQVIHIFIDKNRHYHVLKRLVPVLLFEKSNAGRYLNPRESNVLHRCTTRRCYYF